MPRSPDPSRTAFAFAVAVMLAMAPNADAHKTETKHLKIVHPYVKETAAGATDAVVSMTIHNQGSKSERLIGATSSIAKEARVVGAGAARAIEIPAGQSIELSAQGGHIRLVGLRRPATAYDRLPLSLRFARAGIVKVEIMVEETEAAPGAATSAVNSGQPKAPAQTSQPAAPAAHVHH